MLSPGQRIQDRYEVEALVGQGGLAEVYRVRHVDLGSVHALKLLLFRKKSLADRLLLEGRIQAQLRHPNVVAVTDVVRHDGQYGLLMEYVDNVSLDEMITTRGAMPVDEALTCIAPVMAGVGAAHRAGVLHRDLKPANVLLARTPGGVVPKVADFGIAKVVSEDLEGSTRQGVAMGTPGYMAPEQVLDARGVDVRTDVFALAAILYELISGRRAFADDSGEVSVKSTLEGTFIPLDELVDGVPAHVADAVTRALSRRRDDRPADVEALATLLFREHPALLAQVTGPGTSVPISLDPTAPSSFSLPGTQASDESPPAGRGPTIAPLPTAMTYEGGAVAASASVPPPDTDAGAPPPRFATGLLIGSGFVLLALVVAILLAGPALGWFGTAPSEGDTGEVLVRSSAAGSVSVRPDGPDAPDAVVSMTDGTGQGETPDPSAGVSTSSGTEGGGEDRDLAPAAVPDDVRDGEPAVGSADTDDAAGDGSIEGTTDGSATVADDPEPAADTDAASAGDSSAMAVQSDLVGAGGPDVGGEASGGQTVASGSTGAGTSTADPPTAPMVMPMEVFIESTWQGRVFRQPFTLRMSREGAGQVYAEGRIVLGASQRTVPMVGRFDPRTGSLALKQSNGDLVLQGKVSQGNITGLYWREGKDKREPLSLSRR